MELEEAISKLKYELDKSKIVKKYQGKPEELFDDLDEYIKSIETVLTHITKQDKMIDEMAKALHLFIWENDGKIIITSRPKESCHTLSIEEIKQYFEKKAEEDL